MSLKCLKWLGIKYGNDKAALTHANCYLAYYYSNMRACIAVTNYIGPIITHITPLSATERSAAL